MIKNKLMFLGWGLCFLFLNGFVGCDYLKSLPEKFTKSGKKAEEKQTKATQQPSKSMQAEAPPLAPNVLARVGGWTITKEEFEERLKALKEVLPDYDITNPEARQTVLEELLRQQLLVEDAERSGLAKSKDIASAVEEFRRTLIVREIAGNLVKDITVTDEEARAIYEQFKDRLVEEETFHVREIVLNNQAEANDILIELLKGADFGQMAQTRSIAKSASNSGDLGFIRLTPEEPFSQMTNTILSLNVGNISNVFKGPEGYYIIKVEAKQGGDQIPFEDIKENIVADQTAFKPQQAIEEYLKKLESEVKIEINESLL